MNDLGEINLMKDPDELRRAFEAFFVDPDGFFQLPGNVGGERTLLPVCREILQRSDSLLYRTLNDWDERGTLKTRQGQIPKVLNVGLGLLSLGQWEGAWAVGQLHYDQSVKEEARSGKRLPKGHPACGLAILARQIGSHSLCRHFAILSSAGDIYTEHENPELVHGGLAPTILEQYGSRAEHDRWRGNVRSLFAEVVDKDHPRYLEAYVAAQWFGKAYADRFLDLAEVQGKNGKPFAEVLLNAVQNPGNVSDAVTGTRFEAAAALLVSTTPGFEVRSAREKSDEQVDFVVRYERDPLARLPLPSGPGLVECKSSGTSVSAKELRDFGAKCQFHRVGFGILVARAGISGNPEKRFTEATRAELVRRRLLIDGLPILVLKAGDLFDKAGELRGLQDVLTADYDDLVFGPIAGETETDE